jgi:hypothetical protein
VVYRQKAWYAQLQYDLVVSGPDKRTLPTLEARSAWLGPYRRPRDAMIALEREATVLRNRHGDSVRFGNQFTAEDRFPSP